MAVGIIIGAAFTTIVKSLVNDVLMPPIGVILDGADFADYYINLSGTIVASLAEAKEAGVPMVAYGLLINAIIQFLIVVFALFLVIRWINTVKRSMEKQKEE